MDFPRTSADDPAGSRWWYWVLAVPVYFAAVVAVGAVVLLFAVVGGLGIVHTGESFFGGLLVVGAFFGILVLAVPGLLVAVLFPVGVYFDAEAVADLEDGGWAPDPVVYGLVALAAVLVTNVLLSVPVAVYYLYRRHEALGVP